MELKYIPLPEVETKKYGLLGYFNAFIKPLISLEPAKNDGFFQSFCFRCGGVFISPHNTCQRTSKVV